jgi:hypothetical protein
MMFIFVLKRIWIAGEQTTARLPRRATQKKSRRRTGLDLPLQTVSLRPIAGIRRRRQTTQSVKLMPHSPICSGRFCQFPFVARRRLHASTQGRLEIIVVLPLDYFGISTGSIRDEAVIGFTHLSVFISYRLASSLVPRPDDFDRAMGARRDSQRHAADQESVWLSHLSSAIPYRN